MAKRKRTGTTENSNGASVGYEVQVWQTSHVPRCRRGSAECNHIVLGLILLKYISDAFDEQHAKGLADQKSGTDPEDPVEYRALTIFQVPPEARWAHLKAQAKQSTLDELVVEAMDGTDRDHPAPKSVLPEPYALALYINYADAYRRLRYRPAGRARYRATSTLTIRGPSRSWAGRSGRGDWIGRGC